MGHERRGAHDGSEVGTRYRHTTPELLAQVVAAVDERLVVALRSLPDVDQVWTGDDESPTEQRSMGL
jgi:hypothetical protein